MKKILIPCLLTALLTGCAAEVSYVQPEPVQVKNKITVESSYENTWKHMVKSLSSDFFTINNLEKDSGLINVSFFIANDPQNYADCGTQTVKFGEKTTTYNPIGSADYSLGGMPEVTVSERTSLNGKANIYLEDAGLTKTNVTVNAIYGLTRNIAKVTHTRYGPIRSNGTETATFSTKEPYNGFIYCQTTGTLEQRLLDLAKKSTTVTIKQDSQ